MAATNSGQTSLYIALYDIGQDRFHCALVVTPKNAPLTNVNVYQITNNDPTRPGSIGAWRRNHLVINSLLKSSRLVGCVRLPDSSIPFKDVKEFIDEQEPEQGRTRLEAGAVWDCSQWVLRVVQRFRDATSYNLDMRHLYAKVWIRAKGLKAMRVSMPNLLMSHTLFVYHVQYAIDVTGDVRQY